MTQTNPPFACLCAGGTGGHVFPAEALAGLLLDRGWRLALMTDRRGHAYGGTLGQLQTWPLAAGGLSGVGLVSKARGLVELGIGYWQAHRLLKQQRPDVVVGFGGYASVPGVMAACSLGLPTLIHEQNAVLGRANRLLAGSVNRLATSYPDVRYVKPKWQHKGKVVLVGTPVRPAVLALRDQPYQAPTADGPINLLIIGGSQGAQVFSTVIPQALVALPPSLKARLRVAQQCRPETLDAVRAAYADSGIHEITLQPFFDDVPQRMVDCHLLIARSGASTMAEITTLGRPSLLVPLPSAIDNHQMANADNLAAVGGADLMPQSVFTPEALTAYLVGRFDNPAALSAMASAAAQSALPDAAARLADAVLALKENS